MAIERTSDVLKLAVLLRREAEKAQDGPVRPAAPRVALEPEATMLGICTAYAAMREMGVPRVDAIRSIEAIHFAGSPWTLPRLKSLDDYLTYRMELEHPGYSNLPERLVRMLRVMFLRHAQSPAA